MSLCPVCHVAMVQVEEADVLAASCPGCRGTWISSLASKRRTQLETTPDQPHLNLPPLADLADTVSHSDSKAALGCPTCRRVMTKERFHPKIPVQVDVCEACHYIWLDAGEQGLLVRLYQELVADQGQPDPSQQQRVQRLQNMQNLPPASTYTSGTDGIDVAVSIGATVLGILVDVLLMPSHSSGWHSSSRW